MAESSSQTTASIFRRAPPRILRVLNDGHHTFAAIKNNALSSTEHVQSFGSCLWSKRNQQQAFATLARRNGEALAEVLGLLPGDGLIWG
ncbi:MAG: hypothetical protein WAJ88_16220 [Pseudolabrys sp.]